MTEQQKQDVSKLGWEVVSKAYHTACAHVLGETNAHGVERVNSVDGSIIRGDPQEIRELTSWLTENACVQPKCIGCEFDEISADLNIYLTIVNRNYVAEIDVPSAAYAQDVYKQYNLLKNLAIAYGQYFNSIHPEILARMRAVRPDLSFELTVDSASPTTMYFDPNSEKRIGIYGEYVDRKGRHMIKKRK